MSHVKKLASSKYQARHRGSDGREHARNFGSQAGCGLLASRGDSTCTSGVVDPPEGRPRHPRGVVCHLPRRPAREGRHRSSWSACMALARICLASCIEPALHGSLIHPVEARVHTGSPPSGEPVSTFYDRTSRKPAASLRTEWDDDRVVPVRSDPVRAHNRRRHSDLDVGHQRSRAVIGESYNLPATAVALRPVEAAAPARCTRRRLSVAWVTTRPVPGRLSRFGWGRLAVGGRCLVGGVRQHTVRGRC